MRRKGHRPAALNPYTRRSNFFRQVAALFDSFCQSAATMKCHPEKFHFHSMPWNLKESVVKRPFLTQHTKKNQPSTDGGLRMQPYMNGLSQPKATRALRTILRHGHYSG